MPKHPKPSAKAKATAKPSKAGGVVKAVGRAAVGTVPGGGIALAAFDALKGGKKSGKGGGHFPHKKSAKMKLKRAYERRANRYISMGNLGKARKALAQKRSVV